MPCVRLKTTAYHWVNFFLAWVRNWDFLCLSLVLVGWWGCRAGNASTWTLALLHASIHDPLFACKICKVAFACCHSLLLGQKGPFLVNLVNSGGVRCVQRGKTSAWALALLHASAHGPLFAHEICKVAFASCHSLLLAQNWPKMGVFAQFRLRAWLQKKFHVSEVLVFGPHARCEQCL